MQTLRESQPKANLSVWCLISQARQKAIDASSMAVLFLWWLSSSCEDPVEHEVKTSKPRKVF